MLETTAVYELKLTSRRAIILGLICFALSFTLSTWMYPFMPDFSPNCDTIDPKEFTSSSAQQSEVNATREVNPKELISSPAQQSEVIATKDVTPKELISSPAPQPEVNAIKEVNPKELISSSAQQLEVKAIRDRYLDLMVITLTGYVYDSRSVLPGIGAMKDLQKNTINKELREKGLDWPEIGFTMIGNDALKSIKWMIETVLEKNVPGDFIETGVWRGGASIFAKAVLRAHGVDKIRKVWVCDSFKGLPKARTQNDDNSWELMASLRVDKETVMGNFRKFDLLDENVKFVEGYFVDSLPKIRDELTELSILRLDGDMYESTMDILFNLYEKIVIGGFVIVDDYAISVCQKAITEFRNMHNITSEIKPIWKDDATRVYWVKKDHKSVQHEWYKNFITSS